MAFVSSINEAKKRKTYSQAENLCHLQVEMAQDIDMILPVMVAIFVAKLVADILSRPLYKYLLDIKSLPFLDAEPVVVLNNEE